MMKAYGKGEKEKQKSFSNKTCLIMKLEYNFSK